MTMNGESHSDPPPVPGIDADEKAEAAWRMAWLARSVTKSMSDVVGEIHAEVIKLGLRFDAAGIPRFTPPPLPPMREEHHSTPEEIAAIADQRIDKRKLDSMRVLHRDRRIATYAAAGLVAAAVLEHVWRWLATGHPF